MSAKPRIPLDMIGEIDDDTHYCLKCHSTINGLDNYVSHRKSDCGKALKQVEAIAPKEEPFSLKADDFFSSLELQSSTKKTNAVSSGGKFHIGVITRSKLSAPSRGASTALKPVTEHKTGDAEWLDNDRSHPRLPDYYESDYTDEFDIDEEESDSEEYDDINDAPPRTFTGGKWKPTSSPVQWARSSLSNKDKDWNAPPANYSGGKWHPQTKTVEYYNIHQDQSRGKWKAISTREDRDIPPPTFTGSKWSSSKAISKAEESEFKLNKWKPRSLMTRLDYQSEMAPSEQVRGKSFTQESSSNKFIPSTLTDSKNKLKLNFKRVEVTQTPQPFYTKGKWKPISPNREKAPPTSYTKRKWKPSLPKRSQDADFSDSETEVSPFRKSSGTTQYWCGPCNRHLASKVVYQRHLKSDLHQKRANSDKDFEKPCFGLNLSKKQDQIHTINAGESLTEENLKQLSTRTRKKIYIICHICKSRVHYRSIGKHLISYYHCSRSDMSVSDAEKMILDNIHSIVLQSPFQCGPCKFYCNTHKLFLDHWLSQSHTVDNKSILWCVVCKYKVQNSELMYKHLTSSEHHNIISVINRSVPVVIRKVTPIKCATCDQQFLYNIALRKHCERLSHAYIKECSDEYQSKYKCPNCDVVLKSKIALQRHATFHHNEKHYICSACSLTFTDVLEAKRHRSTPEHRYTVMEKRKKETTGLATSRVCQYCSQRFENPPKLKEHYQKQHPEHHSSCAHCGKVFTIPQDLGVHIRTSACVVEQDVSKAKSCGECKFNTDSASELIFHRLLHRKPLMTVSEDGDESKATYQYKCPICHKYFVKSSLRCHLRLHTKERPFRCTICNAGFVRRNNLILHIKNHAKQKPKQSQKVNTKTELVKRPFVCSTCGAKFKKRAVLHQHMTRHTGRSFKCAFPGCIFLARFPSELKTHSLIHFDEKPYSCSRCSYRGKTKQQLNRHLTLHEEGKKYKCSNCSYSSRLASHLKRHMRGHTGIKPFACPHCKYTCNNLENLRKHVLSTNMHVGKCLYECKFCQGNAFETNFAKDFKVHLVTKHTDRFKTGKDAATYIAGIYDPDNNALATPKEENQDEQVLDNDATLAHFQDGLQPPSTAKSDVSSAALLTSVTSQDSAENKVQEELFPMLIVPKDVICTENPSESWNIGGSYDVEEPGSLAPFQSVGESLFQEHFQ